MAVFPAVPATVAQQIVQVSTQTGVPASWLAAVCSQTNFNDSFVTYYTPGTQCGAQVSRWGMAGVWMIAPEVTQSNLYKGAHCAGTSEFAGWGYLTGGLLGCTDCKCPTLPNAGAYSVLTVSGPPYDTVATLTVAAGLLAYSRIQSSQAVGVDSVLIFYQYVLGCNYQMLSDPATRLPEIPSIPQNLNDIAWYYLQAQAYYSSVFGEVPILYQPPGNPNCPTGYAWNPLLGKCCNTIGQCVTAEVCLGCTQYDQVSNTCLPLSCTLCGCPTGQTCDQASGNCVIACTDNSQCPAPQTCINGRCQTSCSSNSDCVAPNVCVCTTPGNCVCQPPSGGFPWWVILAGLGLAALGIAALYKQPCGGPQDEPCPAGSTCINGYCEVYSPPTYQPTYTRV